MFTYEISLKSVKEVSEFVHAATEIDSDVVLKNPSEAIKVNGKSLLGAMAAIEWESIVLESNEDIGAHFSAFIKD